MDNRGWEKQVSDDGICYYIKFKKIENTGEIPERNSDFKPVFRMGKVRKATEILKIIMAQKGRILGECQVNIFENNVSELRTQDFKGNNGEWRAEKDLPEDLESEREKMPLNIVAIWVDENSRGKKLGTKLIGVTLKSLLRKGINKLDVCSISDGAMPFYEKTGATKIDEKTAVYEDIKSIVKENEQDKVKE